MSDICIVDSCVDFGLEIILDRIYDAVDSIIRAIRLDLIFQVAVYGEDGLPGLSTKRSIELP